MKKIVIALLSILICVVAFAGTKRLSNGEAIYWQDQTPVIEYNSYRVELSLTGKCDFNVWGEVSVGGQSKSFMIRAGETSGYVDFENLDNGRRYSISVRVNN